jgi:hypothetical protein
MWWVVAESPPLYPQGNRCATAADLSVRNVQKSALAPQSATGTLVRGGAAALDVKGIVSTRGSN